MNVQTGRNAVTIDFNKALDILCDAMRGYKVVHRYSSKVQWSFKFEKGARQYDPIDLLYMHLFQTEKAEFHIEYNALKKLGMSSDTVLVLAQLSNGVHRNLKGCLGEHYAGEKTRIRTANRHQIQIRYMGCRCMNSCTE
jgi:hypothetical protein